MSIELPDWLRGTLLLGQTAGGAIVPVLIDASGQINILVRGVDAGGTVRTVRVDNVGQLYAILRGAGGNDVAVDGAGNLAAILKGIDGLGNLRTLLVDASGQAIMVPRGNSGNYLLVDASGFMTTVLKGLGADAALHTVMTDNAGQIIMVPRGSTGNYLLVDASGFMTTVLKGLGADAALHTVMTDNAGQIIMVPRGNTGNYMAVDVNGYLTAVLKGAFGGALNTIAVDASGRIEAFLIDSEDQWGMTVRTGNAGAAAKMGSMQNWDYRGQVYYQTAFENGAKPWLKYPAGTGSEIVIDPSMWLSGGYALKMTAGSDGTHNAYIEALIQRPPTGYTGCEIVWSKAGTTGYVLLELRLYIGGVIYWARLRYSNVDNRMEYWTSMGAWAFWGNPYFVSSQESFNRMKLVVDVVNHNYVRAMWGQTQQDMAGVPLYTPGGGFLNAMYVHIENTGRNASNDVVYLDRVILTAGEPSS
jgi:hypothetical protein